MEPISLLSALFCLLWGAAVWLYLELMRLQTELKSAILPLGANPDDSAENLRKGGSSSAHDGAADGGDPLGGGRRYALPGLSERVLES